MEKPGLLLSNVADINSLLIYPVCSLVQLGRYTRLREQTGK